MLYTVIRVISVIFQIYEFLILIRVLLSWINVSSYRPVINHPIVRILYRVTDPVLVPLQRLIPPIGGAIDISPVVALILLEIIRRVLITFLVRL
jgi:YggT family protein